MVTESQLARFLKDNPPANKFVPYCYLSEQADELTVYFEGDADYSKRLNDHITLYLSLESDEVVGCRVKGVSGIIEDLPNFIRVNLNGVDLAIIFFAFRGGAEEEVCAAIKDLARVAGERNMVLQTNL